MDIIMRMFLKIKEPLLVFVCFYLFFLGNLAANFSGPHDSIAYLNSIISGHPLFHQHHLLYHVSAHYWLQMMQAILPGVPNFYLVEAFTALWGSATTAILYLFFRNRFNLSRILSFICVTVIACSYGVWFYSVNVEVYAMPLFFILWALYILTKTNFRETDFIHVVLLHCFAILFHQINILFTLVILWKAWQMSSSINFKKTILIYGLLGFLIIGGMYFLVGWVIEGHSTMEAWSQWIRGYSTDNKYWQPLSITTPFHVGVGLSHAFVGGHFMFQLPFVETYINNSLPHHALHDEIYLSRNISTTVAEILTAFTILIVLIVLIMIVRFIRYYRSAYKSFPAVLSPILICLGIYSLFFCFWMPEILEFWILQSVLFWLLLLGTMNVVKIQYDFHPVPAVLLLSILLFCVNYFGSIRWMKHIEYDLYYHKVKPLIGKTAGNDVIVVQDAWILMDFIKYYTNNNNIRPVPWNDSLRLVTDEVISRSLSKQGRIYVFPQMNSMFKPPDTRYIDSLSQVYGDRKKIFRTSDPIIWVIE